MCGTPYSVRRISAEYRVAPAAGLAAGAVPDQAVPGATHNPASTHAPVTAAVSGSRRAPDLEHLGYRDKRALSRRENNLDIGFISQVRPIFPLEYLVLY
jgi:hypothetical protein